MKVSLSEAGPTTLRLAAAILLYADERRVLARRHPIVEEEGQAPRLGPGTFVTSSMVKEMLDLADQAPLTYLPEHVVAINRFAMAWFDPARSRTMYFRPTSDAAAAAFDGKPIPQPPLLFVARRHALDVFALADNVRPRLDTALYLAPFWNIFGGARGGEGVRVCVGSMVLPEAIEPAMTGAWADAFFASNFTHLSSGKRWARPGTYAELLAAASERGTFDPAWLVPAQLTLEEAVCSN